MINKGHRLDILIASLNSGFSRSVIQKFIREVGVLVNGKRVNKPHFLLNEGDDCTITKEELDAFLQKYTAEKIGLAVTDANSTILYEDNGIVIFDKPAGIRTEALIKGFLPVHRLDKDTSGVLAAAKNVAKQASLQSQWQKKVVHKTYLTLVKGTLTPKTGAIEGSIFRSMKDRRKMAISGSTKARSSLTEYEVVGYLDEPVSDEKFTLVKAFPKTGRTHQIRVHFASIHHPVVGDSVYGDKRINNIFAKKYGLQRQFLHAAKLELVNPSTKKHTVFTSKTPDDLAGVLKRLEKYILIPLGGTG